MTSRHYHLSIDSWIYVIAPFLLSILNIFSEMIPGPRKRSWVWKYFDRLSNIIYRCRLCNVVLSIKGCNSNNMNRHVRTRHPLVFKSEVTKRERVDSVHVVTSEVDTPYAIKTEEIYASDKDYEEISGKNIFFIRIIFVFTKKIFESIFVML